MKLSAKLAVVAVGSCQTSALRRNLPLPCRAYFSTNLNGRATATDILKREAEKNLITDGYR